MSDETLSRWAGGRHPVNVLHLVMGLAFLGLAGVWWLVANDVVAQDEVRWLLPVPWVVAGLGGLAALAVNGTRRHAVHSSGWLPADPADSDPQH